MLNYVKYQNNNSASKSYGEYFLRAVQDETIDLLGLAEHMAEHNSPFTTGTILGIMTDAIKCTREMLEKGKAVKFDNFAIFRLGFTCKGAKTAAEAQPRNITAININAMGTGAMSASNLLSTATFKEVRKYSGFVETVEDQEQEEQNQQTGNQTQNPGNQTQNPGNQTQEPGNQTGGGTPTGGTVTIQWLDNFNQEKKSIEVAVGGSIQQSDIPAASGSNHWDKNLAQINAELATATAGSTITVKEQGDDF